MFFQGIKACKPSDVASAIFSAVKKFKPAQHVKQVTVVVFQNDMAAEFIAELKKDVHTHRHKDTRSEEHRKSIKIKIKTVLKIDNAWIYSFLGLAKKKNTNH